MLNVLFTSTAMSFGSFYRIFSIPSTPPLAMRWGGGGGGGESEMRIQVTASFFPPFIRAELSSVNA